MYRALLPRYFLRKLRPNVSEAKAIGAVSRLDIKRADVIIFQRLHIKEHAELFTWARAENKKLIYEIDDSVWTIPTWNPAYYVWPNKEMQDRVSHFIAICDAATCTTESLAVEMRQWNKKVFVLPNSLNLDMWKEFAFNVPKANHDELRIGWGGSPTHKDDLMSIARVLVDIAWKYRKKKLKYYFMGYMPPELVEKLSGYVHFTRGVSIGAFPNTLHALHLDIGLAPLVDCAFNRAKSNIKWLEYSALNVPVIASNVGPYKDSIVHEKTGFLCDNTYESWYKNLSRMIENADLRVTVARNAHNEVYQNYDSRKNAQLWLKVFESLFTEEELLAINERDRLELESRNPPAELEILDASKDEVNMIKTESKRVDSF